MRRAFVAATLALLAGCVPRSAPWLPSQTFSFALIGDAPYRAADEPRFAALLDEINDTPVRFVLHAGDLKGSGESCADDLLRARLSQFGAVRGALVYTPGDNDWTDCHRAAAGRFHPLERLAALRRLAFPDPHRSFGQRPLALRSQAEDEAQAEFVENTMFASGRVLFATVHVVGSNNDLEPWQGIDPSDRADRPRADRIAAFRRREAAARAWLQRAFAEAIANQAVGVVVLMQANPRFDLPAGDPRRAGFDSVIRTLREQARRFKRPVLLAHGDRHLYLVDRPLADSTPPVPNLLRVQPLGHPWLAWVRVTVDPGSTEVFQVQPGESPAPYR